jgi:Sulfotransferase family
MIYLKDKNILFISVPKNASSSFSELLKPFAYAYSDKHLTLSQIKASTNLYDSAKKIAIIRDPIERLLSLYLYRSRQRRYGTCLPSPAHFRSKVLEGQGKLLDHSWQMLLQTDFMHISEGVWWDYKDIDTLASILASKPLPIVNKSTNLPYEQLISKFYDYETLQLVKKAYRADILLYNEIKNVRKTGLEN